VSASSCDSAPLAEWRQATSILVTPPGTGKPLRAELPTYPILDYCGAGEPDNRVDVTPIEPTTAAIYPAH
jgi:hypothetical protein